MVVNKRIKKSFNLSQLENSTHLFNNFFEKVGERKLVTCHTLIMLSHSNMCHDTRAYYTYCHCQVQTCGILKFKRNERFLILESKRVFKFYVLEKEV